MQSALLSDVPRVFHRSIQRKQKKKKKEGVGFDTSTREAENTGVITLYRGVSQKLTSVRGCDAVLSEMSLS